MKNITLNELSFSNYKLKIIGEINDAKKGQICEIIAPNNFDPEYNDGFIIKNIENGDYYQVVLKINDFYKQFIDLYDFPLIEISQFIYYFAVLDE